MKFRLYIAAVGLAFGLSACQTPYGSKGLLGGVEEERINPNTYKITATGNGFSSPARMHDFVLMRASELALRDGYPYFVVLSETRTVTGERFVTPGNFLPMRSGTGASAGVPSSSSIYVPPSIYSTAEPKDEATVRLLRTRAEVTGGVMDAQQTSLQVGRRLD